MTADPSTTASIRQGYQITSPPMKIGKTFWRFVVLPSRYGPGLVTDYEWLNTEYSNAGIWYPSNQWRSYNINDGMYAGLPKTLRKLWQLHSREYERLCAALDPPVGATADTP